jgi:methyl-accepting chemotaxis protein
MKLSSVVAKISAAFAGIVVLGIAASLLAAWQVHRLGDPTKTVFYKESAGIEAVRDTNTRMFESAHDQYRAQTATTPKEFEEFRKSSFEEMDEGLAAITEYTKGVEDATLRRQLKHYRALLVEQRATRAKLFAVAAADFASRLDSPEVLTLNDHAEELIEAADEVSDALAERSLAISKADAERQKSTAERSLAEVAGVLALTILAAVGVAFLLARSLRRRIGALLACLTELRDRCAAGLEAGLAAVADGDLTVNVDAEAPVLEDASNDELGRIAHAVNDLRERTLSSVAAYNRTREQLAQTVRELTTSATTVSTASADMAATSDEAERAITETAGAVEQVAAGAVRQARMVEAANASADDSQRVAAEAGSVAEEGLAASAAADAAMAELRASSAEVATAIGALARKSSEITGIVETISGIAGQTNLLALNAAIEAARAGEQGRGFAVVAEEVRKLAEESQAAAQSIATIIDEIETDTQRVVEVVEAGVRRTEEGAATASAAGEAFTRIGTAVAAVRERVEEIARVTADVAGVANETSAASEGASASTEETAASAKHVASAAQQLAATAQQLEAVVGRFRL